ncbi:hypothetical protein [Agrobacterium vitis]|uniref:hypothetical protein n=1 Tax=Agrobacterium vitis TaxID=373 RepID=UPI001574E454|nr:hypothetical protein [Agrobacterium vitis]NSY21877.1 hypothetical protein [Agrobacterium vitis]WEO73167.1 hypothetical protein G6L01_007570 [Agrobacterium vitis]
MNSEIDNLTVFGMPLKQADALITLLEFALELYGKEAARKIWEESELPQVSDLLNKSA